MIETTDAYKQGELARENNEPRDANPHVPNSFYYKEWQAGWDHTDFFTD